MSVRILRNSRKQMWHCKFVRNVHWSLLAFVCLRAFSTGYLQSIDPMYNYNQRSISHENAFKDNPVAFLSIFALEQTRYCMLYIINFYTSLFNPFMMIRKEGEKEQLWNVVVFTFCCLCFDILLPFSIQPHPPPHNHKWNDLTFRYFPLHFHCNPPLPKQGSISGVEEEGHWL